MTEEEQYVSDMQDMFMTAGWKLLIGEMEATSESLNDIRNIKDIEQLEFNKGMLALINSLLSLPDEVSDMAHAEVQH